MPEYGHHLPADLNPVTTPDVRSPTPSAISTARCSKLRGLIARCERHAQDGRRHSSFSAITSTAGRKARRRSLCDGLQSRLPEHVIALKGNHEAVALGVIDGKTSADYWLTQGGAATLRSYGVDSARRYRANTSIGCVRYR